MSTSVSIRISDDLIKKLNDLAKETERSRSFLIQKALEAYLDELADLQIALDRMHDAADPIISIDDMRKELET
ncbi:MAG: ribbon-helix-helix protein, CopG family [Candidatus Aminicenantes bacterium]|nr:ribbon-helix-helix protein, CopG family [Candidatus Aminicenantes bacterium]